MQNACTARFQTAKIRFFLALVKDFSRIFLLFRKAPYKKESAVGVIL